jgi:hypothetical protein
LQIHILVHTMRCTAGTRPGSALKQQSPAFRQRTLFRGAQGDRRAGDDSAFPDGTVRLREGFSSGARRAGRRGKGAKCPPMRPESEPVERETCDLSTDRLSGAPSRA